MYEWSKLRETEASKLKAEQEKQAKEAAELQLKKEEEAQLLAKRKLYDNISDNLSIGLENLNRHELNILYGLVLYLIDDKDIEENERKLAWKALKDPAFVNYVQVKQSSQNLTQQNALLEKLGVQLSKISSDSSSIKTTNLVSGMLAARHLGEEMAEDFGGGD